MTITTGARQCRCCVRIADRGRFPLCKIHTDTPIHIPNADFEFELVLCAHSILYCIIMYYNVMVRGDSGEFGMARTFLLILD